MTKDIRFGFKNITTGAILFSVLLFNVCLSGSCLAEQGAAIKPVYEQITKQYPSMVQYIAQARKSVKNNWYPSSSSFENSATIVLRISKSGDLLDSYISVSSNDKNFDDSLLKAVKKTKFAPLPDEVKEDSVDIDLSFEMKRRSILK